jgi:HrpA-like RNA helicase
VSAYYVVVIEQALKPFFIFQARAMKRAQDVRKQLVTILDRYKMDILSAGRNYKKIQKAICSGYFTHVAKKDPTEGYKTIVDNTPVHIHPSSALFNKNPECVLSGRPHPLALARPVTSSLVHARLN